MPNFHYPNPLDPALPLVGRASHEKLSCDMPLSAARDSEPRRRRKDSTTDLATPSPSSKDKPRRHRLHKASASEEAAASSNRKIPSGKSTARSREREREREREQDRERDVNYSPPRSSVSDRSSPRKVKMVVPEMERRPAAVPTTGSSEVRNKNSYPTFSKAHSREAVGSREEIAKKEPYTPEATEVEQSRDKRRTSAPAKAPPTRAPPSPPLTVDEPEMQRSDSGASMRKAADRAKQDMASGRRSTESERTLHEVKNAKSGSSLRREARFEESEVSSSMPGAFPDDGDRRSTPNSGYRRTASTASQPPSAVSRTTMDSQATSVDPKRKAARPPNIIPVQESSPPSVTDSQPKTPTPEEQYFPPEVKGTPVHYVSGSRTTTPWSGITPNATHTAPPPPPPPPPPMTGTGETPRVDYLLKNGGLPYMVPKKLVQSGPSVPVQQYSMYQSPGLMQAAPSEAYERIFAGVHQRLDDFLQVLHRSGSMAVATGYRSVARRLLDKLSQIFARDISSQRCDCVICRLSPQPRLSDEEDTGVSWGEILEFVSGRRELPQWPPFYITPDDTGLGLSGVTQAPMQKLDIDVPPEYREHYIKQNKKTKVAVQNWLAQQPELPSGGPPDEADEDTLMFAMMTKLSVQQRNLLIALMHGLTSVAETRTPTPAQRPADSSDALKRARRALQRLYRLERPPRDCECAMYLLNNPQLHGMLATLAEVNEGEWDILVSGRFDGFLWSGAERRQPWPGSASQYNGSMRMPSRNQSTTPFSRNATPFSGMSGYVPSRGPTPLRGPQPSGLFPSRGPTPAPDGAVGIPAPVQMDEETEIAVLSEVERGIYTDMERLEDAFEVLHGRAELVRQLLRERSAGLSMQSRFRRGSNNEPSVRLDTPASGYTNFDDEEDDDGMADMISLAPDDSASNIGANRRQRRNERKERKTPAPVEEEIGSVFEEDQQQRKTSGRRR